MVLQYKVYKLSYVIYLLYDSIIPGYHCKGYTNKLQSRENRREEKWGRKESFLKYSKESVYWAEPVGRKRDRDKEVGGIR